MANYVIGVDLGQVYDHSALAIVERLEERAAAELAGITTLDHHHVRYIKRWELGTEYDQVVKDTADLIRRRPDLQDAVIILDATGVGRRVADLFMQAHRLGRLTSWWPRPYVITGGRETTAELVPKRELVGTMQTLLQSGRLKIADALPEAEILKNELMNFKVKTSPTGQETFEAARESIHDDITLAVALACWFRHTLSPARLIEGDVVQEQVRYA